jgi:hypothetical protein
LISPRAVPASDGEGEGEEDGPDWSCGMASAPALFGPDSDG